MLKKLSKVELARREAIKKIITKSSPLLLGISLNHESYERIKIHKPSMTEEDIYYSLDMQMNDPEISPSSSPSAVYINVWTGSGGDNNWNNAYNWSKHHIPIASDDVFINDMSTVVINDGETGVCRTISVAIGAELIIENNATFEIQTTQ